MSMFGLGFGMFNVGLWLFIIVAWIYSLVLFIKLAHRGIKALDIYIGKNKEF
jgi:hypothetical protein